MVTRFCTVCLEEREHLEGQGQATALSHRHQGEEQGMHVEVRLQALLRPAKKVELAKGPASPLWLSVQCSSAAFFLLSFPELAFLPELPSRLPELALSDNDAFPTRVHHPSQAFAGRLSGILISQFPPHLLLRNRLLKAYLLLSIPLATFLVGRSLFSTFPHVSSCQGLCPHC